MMGLFIFKMGQKTKKLKSEELCQDRGFHTFEHFETSGDNLDGCEVESSCEECGVTFRGRID